MEGVIMGIREIGSRANSEIGRFKEKGSNEIKKLANNNDDTQSSSTTSSSSEPRERAEINGNDSQGGVKKSTTKKIADSFLDSSITDDNKRVENQEKKYDKLTKAGWEKEIGENDQGERTVSYTKETDKREYEINLEPKQGTNETHKVRENGEEIYNSSEVNHALKDDYSTTKEAKKSMQDHIKTDMLLVDYNENKEHIPEPIMSSVEKTADHIHDFGDSTDNAKDATGNAKDLIGNAGDKIKKSA
jgi:hypothetical protein